MKITNNLVIVDLKNTDEEYLLVNSLNGLVDVISKSEFLIIKKWIEQKEIIPKNGEEDSFFKQLCQRQHIMMADEEKRLKNDLLNALAEQHQSIINAPQKAIFIFSYECNFACPYCYERDIPKADAVFTKKMTDAVLDLYPDRKPKYISFFGGEPLLPKNKKIIEYIVQKLPDAKYSVTTNGYFLKDYFEVFKNTNTKQIQVTIDGSRDSHNKTRYLKNGEPTYDKIFDGIRLYLENKIPVKIRMNASCDNIQECLEEKENLARELNSEFLTFEIQGLFQSENEARLTIFKELFENNTKIKKQKNQLLNHLSPISGFLYNNTKIKPTINICISSEQNRFYDNNGDMYACILSVGNKEKSIGKFYPEIAYKENSILNRNILKIEKCKNCRYALMCGAGCPNAIIEQDGNAFKENCFNLQYELEYIVPYLYNKKYNKTSRI